MWIVGNINQKVLQSASALLQSTLWWDANVPNAPAKYQRCHHNIVTVPITKSSATKLITTLTNKQVGPRWVSIVTVAPERRWRRQTQTRKHSYLYGEYETIDNTWKRLIWLSQPHANNLSGLFICLRCRRISSPFCVLYVVINIEGPSLVFFAATSRATRRFCLFKRLLLSRWFDGTLPVPIKQ